MRMTTLLTAAAVAGIMAAPALAQPPGGGAGRGLLPAFEEMDANKDGKVSKEEFTKALPEQAQQFADRIFDSRDVNPKDGYLSKEENAAAPAMGGGRGRGAGGAPGQQ